MNNEKKTAIHFVKSRSYDRGSRCQKFEHNATRCTRVMACRVCVAEHETKRHFCQACKVTAKPCQHIKALCANCEKKHEVNYTQCEMYLAVRNLTTTTTTT